MVASVNKLDNACQVEEHKVEFKITKHGGQMYITLLKPKVLRNYSYPKRRKTFNPAKYFAYKRKNPEGIELGLDWWVVSFRGALFGKTNCRWLMDSKGRRRTVIIED